MYIPVSWIIFCSSYVVQCHVQERNVLLTWRPTNFLLLRLGSLQRHIQIHIAASVDPRAAKKKIRKFGFKAKWVMNRPFYASCLGAIIMCVYIYIMCMTTFKLYLHNLDVKDLVVGSKNGNKWNHRPVPAWILMKSYDSGYAFLLFSHGFCWLLPSLSVSFLPTLEEIPRYATSPDNIHRVWWLLIIITDWLSLIIIDYH